MAVRSRWALCGFQLPVAYSVWPSGHVGLCLFSATSGIQHKGVMSGVLGGLCLLLATSGAQHVAVMSSWALLSATSGIWHVA